MNLKQFYRYITVFLLTVFVFSGCGSSEGDASTSLSSQPSAKGVAQLGYISGGTVSIYKITDLDNPLATTQTVKSKDLTKAGRFEFKKLVLDDNTYYLLTVTNGEDIDADDNGIVDNIATDLNGTVHALVTGSMLKNGISLNAFTDVLYEKVEKNLKTLTSSELSDALNKNAKNYFFDVDKDGKVDYQDVLGFNPILDKDKTKQSYSQMLDLYIPKLHKNESKVNKLSTLMYLDSPNIVIKNGKLQEVPFKLKATLSNEPKGLTVKWFVNNSKKTIINETISKDGIYKVTAKLYSGETYLKTVDTSIIATTKIEIASAQASSGTESEIIVDTESNSSLAGTQIYIPKGALKEDTKIVIKKASINAIPSDNGAVSISDVLVLQPSGLTFEKPIQVRLPYNENLDLTNQTIRIARYSEGGQVDYIAPLYVDEEKHEIVFETEHFTEFKAETDIIGQSADEEFIDKLNRHFPSTHPKMHEWEAILNIRLGKNFTVYDSVVEYFKNKNIVFIIDADKNWKGYSEAYSQLYGDSGVMSKTYERWDSIKDGFEYINQIKGFSGGLKDGLMNIIGLPKIDESLADPSGDYDKYIFATADKIIDKFENIQLGKQIETYFNLRNKGFSAISIISDLESSIGKTDDFIDTVGDNRAKNGWFELFSFSAKIAEETPPNNLWARIDTMYSIYSNFESTKYDDDYNEITSKEVMINIFDVAEVEVKANGKRLNINECTVKLETKSPIIGDKVIFDVLCSLDTNLANDYESSVRIVRYDDNIYSDEYGERIIYDAKITKITKQHYKISVLEEYAKNRQYIIYYAISNNKYGLEDRDSAYFNVTIKEKKKEAIIKKLNLNGYLQKDGLSYQVTVTPELNTMINPPLDVLGQYKGKTLGKNFEILKDDFNDFALQNIPFTISLRDSAKDAYDVETLHTEINVKSLLEKALKDREDNIVDTSIEVPKLLATSSRNIRVGEKVTFKVNKKNIKREIQKSFYGSVTRKVIDDSYVYEITYFKKGVFLPSIEVELTNGKREDIYAKKVVVSVIPEVLGANTDPMVKRFQFENISSNTATTIYLEASDADGDTLSSEIISTPKHGSVEGTGTVLTYTPSQNYVGKDSFSYRVKDANGGVSKEAIISLKVIEVKPAEIRKVEYSENNPKDECISYSETGCEKLIERGQNFEKVWNFKNIGNVALNGLKVVPISSSTNTDLTIEFKENIATTLAVNETGSYKLNIVVPTNTRAGIHKALYKLTSAKGSVYYDNEKKKEAYFWYKFTVADNFPQITLKELPTGVENSIFTFEAELSKKLDADYSVKISLGDSGGGYLSPKEMISNVNRTSFSLARKIGTSGDRVYRVAIFDGIKRMSSWVEGSYKVVSISSVPQNLKFEQRADGVLISWDAVSGASDYELYTTLGGKADGDSVSIQGSPSGIEWKSATSYLFDKSYFDTQKTWYFMVQADNGELSKVVKFTWEDIIQSKYGTYTQDDKRIIITGGKANLDQSSTPNFQFNLKHDIGNNKDVVQITTNYHTKEAFDTAFGSNNSMLISFDNGKIQNIGMELAGQGWIGNEHVSSGYSATVLNNSDGTYNLTSTGSFISNSRTISAINAKNIMFKGSTGEDGTLSNLIVGKTFYSKCGTTVDTIIFQTNGKLKVIENGGDFFYDNYTISGNILTTEDDEDGTETHVFKDSSSEYVRFTESNGDITTLYFNKNDAQNTPDNDDCGGDDYGENSSFSFNYDNVSYSGNQRGTTKSYVDRHIVHINTKSSSEDWDTNGAIVISTKYTTNDEFKNAFSSNILYLDKTLISRIGLKHNNEWIELNTISGSLKLILSNDEKTIKLVQNTANIEYDGKKLTNLDMTIFRSDGVHNNEDSNNDNNDDVTSPASISNFRLEEVGEGDGKIKATYRISSGSSLSNVKLNCSEDYNVGRSSRYNYKSTTGSTRIGSGSIILSNSDWLGEKVYCKLEVWTPKARPSISYSNISNISLKNKTAGIPTSAPRLSRPSNNSRITDTTPKLDWSSVDKADHYKIYLYGVDDGSRELTGRYTSRSYYNMPSSDRLEKGKTYEWYVKACNANRECGPISQKYRFTVR